MFAMGNKKYFRLFFLISLFLMLPHVILAQSSPKEVRTLYAIGDFMASSPFPLQVYDVVGDDIVLNRTLMLSGSLSVGLAIDEINEIIFVANEWQYNEINAFDAVYGTYLGKIEIDFYFLASFAGLAVHQEKGLLYAIARDISRMWVFDTTTFELVETWWWPDNQTYWDAKLLGDLLFVANYYTVSWYDINTRQLVGTFRQSEFPISIAITDYPELTVFSQAFDGQSAISSYLLKYSIDSGIEEKLLTGEISMGLAVNPELLEVYSVFDDKINVIDYETMTVKYVHLLPPGWVPTDIEATSLEAGVRVEKSCISHPDGQFVAGDTVTFKIKVRNRYLADIYYLDLVDVYDVNKISYQSATISPDDQTDDGHMDWTDFLSNHGGDLIENESFEIEVTFVATEDCMGIIHGVNEAQAVNIFDADNEPVSDSIGKFNYTINCKCQSDSQCDDGLYCNGEEFCKDDGICQEGEKPCFDDGEFCNGIESCDDKNDQCLHSPNPCLPGFTCDEINDECISSDLTDDDSDNDGDSGSIDNWPDGEVTGGCCGCGC